MAPHAPCNVLRRDAQCVYVCPLGRDAELEAAVRLDPARQLLRRRPRHSPAQADRLRDKRYRGLKKLRSKIRLLQLLNLWIHTG